MNFRIIAVLLFLISGATNTHTSTGGNAYAGPQDHKTGVEERGDHVMGFSHDKATHHFVLYPDGGAIELEANTASDTTTRDQIRMHLGHIAQMFAEGDFQAPMLIHDQVPPGVPTLQRLKKDISYRFEEMDRGGRVRISTKNQEALKAIYEFLRFQISDHHTGDSEKVSPVKKP
jgi:hypothetical protein